MSEIKKLRRPREGRFLAGVALGMANYVKVDVVVMRLIWVLLLIPGGFPGLVLYLAAWLIMPEED